MKIFVINGAPRAGKDTFVLNCQELIGKNRCLNVSTVDFVKEIALKAGWDGKKTPEARKFLSDLKDIMTEYGDIPFQKIKGAVSSFRWTLEEYATDWYAENSLIFIHCREPKEIARFEEELGAQSLLIRRPDIEKVEQSNHADAEVLNYNYTYTIYNDGTLDELKQKAIDFVTKHIVL